MMKKLLALMLSLLMLLSMTVVFTGCGDEDTKVKSKKSDKSASDEDKDEDEDEDKDDKDDKDDKSESKSTKKSGNSADVTIDETVLVDQDGIKITATGLEKDSFYGTAVNVLVENTGSVDAMIDTVTTVVNDCVISGFFYCEVSAGKKANDKIELDTDSLATLGIDTIGLIELSFSACDDDYNSIFETDLVSLKTSGYDKMDTLSDGEMGTELYNQNNVKICAQYFYEDDWDQGVLLVIENKTGKEITAECDSLSANGFELSSAFMYNHILKDKTMVYELMISNSNLEDNGIDTIEELGMKFEFTDTKSFEPFLETGDLTLKVS